MVMDTKYKADDLPSADDIAQVIAYAESIGCRDAILVYPYGSIKRQDFFVGRIRVRSLAFLIENDIAAAGKGFLANMFAEALS